MPTPDLFGWLGQVAQYIGSWVPKPQRIVPPEIGVRLRSLGWFLIDRPEWWRTFAPWTPPSPRPITLYTGIHFYIPALTEVTVYSTAEDEYPLVSLPHLTSEGATVCVGGVATCKIRSPVRCALRCVMVKEKIEVTVWRAISREVARRTLLELSEALARGDLEKEITRTVAGEMRGYGVKVLRVTVSVGAAIVLHHSKAPIVGTSLWTDVL